MRIVKIIFSLSCFILLSGCNTTNEASTNQMKSDILYIDFANELNHNHYLYMLKINNNYNEEQLLLKKTLEDYPTSAYAKKSNKIYYTGSINKKYQIFEKNIINKKSKQVTKDFYYVDLLSLNDTEKIMYMRVLLNQGDRSFKTVIYDLETAKYKILYPNNKDSSVVAFDYNPKTKELLVITKSLKEEAGNIELANKTNTPPKPPKYHFSLYTEQGEYKKSILTLSKFVRSASLSKKGDELLINYKDGLELNQPSKMVNFNIKNNNSKVLIEESQDYINIRQPIYSKDNKGFYFIADINTEKVPETASAVYYYDFQTKEIKEIWKKGNGQAINLYRNKVSD
ncbi:hypothetical protein [Bacillus massilinigeriensis]|uniref:hypothetical protein n=1 Tax=Bacillus mediterraneensis TaxID=1805474 RepID=UPI0008F82C91|nr:hypothetical protein [Bacillus mediterraneensis]